MKNLDRKNKFFVITAVFMVMTITVFGQTADDCVSNAVVKYVQGDISGAIADYNQAITLKPDDAFLYYGRGRLKQVQDDLPGALADFNKASEILPGNDRIQGKIDEVKAALAAAPAVVSPTNVVATPVTTNPASTSPDDAVGIQGSWSRTSSALGDSALPAEFLKPLTCKFSDGKYEKTLNGDAPVKGTYAMDASTNPKSLTLTCTEGEESGTTTLGIYELDGDTLRICVDPPGTNRPSSFQSSSTTQLFIETYKRVPQ